LTTIDCTDEPERRLPRNSVNSTSISFKASDSRSFSAGAASSSTCSGEAGRAGLADANAARAASFAIFLILITALTSALPFRAQYACLSRTEVTSKNTWHFSSGDN
jgi:hypothetical protein